MQSLRDFLVFPCCVWFVGSYQSCLALRYEALVFRENKSGVHQWLQVGHTEWVNFAKDALDNGFYPIATKVACYYCNSSNVSTVLLSGK